MRCRRARIAMVDRRAGRLTPDLRDDLDRHLARCTACAAQLHQEEAVARDLGLLRRFAPVRVDVTARVMREIADSEIERREVPGRQIVWAAAAALAALAAITLVAVRDLPAAVHEAAAGTRVLATGIGSVGPALGRPLAALGVVSGALARIALDLLETASRLAGMLAPVNDAVMAFSLIVMLAVTTLVIARDLCGLPVTPAKKERWR